MESGESQSSIESAVPDPGPDPVGSIPNSSPSLSHEEEEEAQSQPQNQPRLTHGLNLFAHPVVSNAAGEEVWASFIVLIIFWFFASMAVILGLYGPSKLQVGPNCSRLIQINSFFVQSIKAELLNESYDELVLYGFYKHPPLDVLITWSDSHDAIVESDDYKVWQYFLNKGSNVHISYNVEAPSSVELTLIISEGKEYLESFEASSCANTTQSCYIIHGNGMIEKDILRSQWLYIALASSNAESVKVQLNFTMTAFVYNTIEAYYRCSMSHQICDWRLYLSGTNAAVLSSPGPQKGMTSHDWYVKLSYGPRWISYFVGSAVMTVLILVVIKVCVTFWVTRRGGGRLHAAIRSSDQAPFLSRNDDMSSCGSSYGEMSHDEDEFGQQLAKEGTSFNPHLCVLCLDASRDCFFLPCGHSAICFTCGTRTLEEAGACPICRKTVRKVRKIYSV